jgi:epithelial splicing regulatory protein 1/2
MMETPYLCVLYVATAGQQGPGLGADEEEIVLLVYIVIDMAQNKVRKLFFLFLKTCLSWSRYYGSVTL